MSERQILEGREFSSNFHWRLASECPPGLELQRFPERMTGQDGLFVRLEMPDGEQRLLSFAFHDYSGGPSAVLGHPDPDKLCVISRSAAYVYDSRGAGQVEMLPLNPVLHVRVSVDAGVILLGDDWGVLALDATGVRWFHPRLVIDGYHLEALNEREVRIRPLYPEDSEEITVDLRTGRVDPPGGGLQFLA